MTSPFWFQHQYESALFWADKVVSLSGNEVQDVFWYAQTLYLTSQFHRAAHLLSSRQLHKVENTCTVERATVYVGVRVRWVLSSTTESSSCVSRSILPADTSLPSVT